MYFEGAAHSAEIEYALGNLPTNRVYDWQPDDYMVSAIMQGYFVNFIKTKIPMVLVCRIGHCTKPGKKIPSCTSVLKHTGNRKRTGTDIFILKNRAANNSESSSDF